MELQTMFGGNTHLSIGFHVGIKWYNIIYIYILSKVEGALKPKF